MKVTFNTGGIFNYNSKLNKNNMFGNLTGINDPSKKEQNNPLSSITNFKGMSDVQIRNAITKKFYEEQRAREREENIRAQKSLLEEQLENVREIQKAFEEQEKQEKISKKIARGEATPEEEGYLAEKNPELHRKAVMAKENADNVRSMIKRAQTAEDARDIIATAKALACGIMEKDLVLGKLMIEGINKVEEDYNKNQLDETDEVNKIMNKAISSYKKALDMKNQKEDFPEELVVNVDLENEPKTQKAMRLGANTSFAPRVSFKK